MVCRHVVQGAEGRQAITTLLLPPRHADLGIPPLVFGFEVEAKRPVERGIARQAPCSGRQPARRAENARHHHQAAAQRAAARRTLRFALTAKIERLVAPSLARCNLADRAATDAEKLCDLAIRVCALSQKLFDSADQCGRKHGLRDRGPGFGEVRGCSSKKPKKRPAAGNCLSGGGPVGIPDLA